MECVQIDLNNVCRTCKNESPEMKSLYHKDSEAGNVTPHLDEMLMACASVQVSNDDGLPKSICPSCILQLKNAYSFKEQCEKTDSFLRDYLKNLKKESIKEEVVTDLEFTPSFISEINLSLKDICQIKDDKSIENIKDDPESHSGESSEKDVDYVQVVDNNITIYGCRNCLKVFYTLEDFECHKRIHIDNIEEHCMKMDFEDNAVTFSDQSDCRAGDDVVVAEETMKPETEVSESNDQEKIDETAQIANEICPEEDPLQMLMKTKIEEEKYRVADDAEAKEEESEVDNASIYSEYLPTKQTPPKIKRGRGRPRKHSVSFKPTGKSRGRPPLLKLKSKSSKNDIVNFPCPQCEEVFAKTSLLKKHAEQHDVLRIHECDACNKKFRRRENLKQHKLSHVDVKPFQCTLCGKCFKRKDHLQTHMKLHSSTEVHSCDLCNAVFNRPENLAEHKDSKHNAGEKIMGKKKNFLCSECGKRFIRKEDLMVHMKRHRGEKPFECKFCGKGFPRKTDLTAHERYHTGEKRHVCVTCGRGFGRGYNLTVHMRTHTGEKPYRCTYCDAAFAQGYDLKAHVRRHTGERFHCELCPKTFIMRYMLTQHKRAVHGLNIVVNQGRLQPINKLNLDDPPLVTVSDPVQLQQIEVSELKQEHESDIM